MNFMPFIRRPPPVGASTLTALAPHPRDPRGEQVGGTGRADAPTPRLCGGRTRDQGAPQSFSSALASAMPPIEQPHSLLFDSLRTLAALAVVVYHIGFGIWAHREPWANRDAWYGGFISHLNVGITLFFLISGFLLYRPYARAHLRGGPLPSIAWYARRRVLRIVPAYWVALTVLACWPGLEGVFTKEWWVYYDFAQSYQFRWAFSGIEPTWSLSVEVAFYALLPFLGLALRSAGPRASGARSRTPAARRAHSAGSRRGDLPSRCLLRRDVECLGLLASLPALVLDRHGARGL